MLPNLDGKVIHKTPRPGTPAKEDTESEDSILQYEMLSDLFDFEKLKESDLFAIKKYKKDGSVYKGE